MIDRERIIKDVLKSFVYLNGEYWETDEGREIVETALNLNISRLADFQQKPLPLTFRRLRNADRKPCRPLFPFLFSVGGNNIFPFSFSVNLTD